MQRSSRKIGRQSLSAKLLAALVLLALTPLTNSIVPSLDASYLLIGVSGGLQHGFPAHTKLHYHGEGEGKDEQVKAIFLGRGLVRGYKAFLDLMEPSWREYDEKTPVINSNVFASGCYEHANEYWLYLVDVRQATLILNNEPRFLSMTPDTGMIELDANETFPIARDFLRAHLQNKGDIDKVAIPLVTCVFFQENSHIPSPPMYIKDDGTEVTNFPDSLALWAKVNDSDRTALLEVRNQCESNRNESQTCIPSVWEEAVLAEKRYWNGIRAAIWNGERNRPRKDEIDTYAPPFKCKQKVRFGVGKEGDGSRTARLNYPLTTSQLQQLLNDIDYQPDFGKGEIVKIKVDRDGSLSEL